MIAYAAYCSRSILRYVVLPAVLVASAHKTLELFDPKDYNKPNDAFLIDVEVATRQGDCNW